MHDLIIKVASLGVLLHGILEIRAENISPIEKKLDESGALLEYSEAQIKNGIQSPKKLVSVKFVKPINFEALALLQELPNPNEVSVFLDGVRAAESTKILKHLQSLSQVQGITVSFTARDVISDNDILPLCDLEKLRGIQVLGKGSLITDRSLERIATCTEISVLALHSTSITDEGIKKLQNLKKLNTLWLADNDISGKTLTFPSDNAITHLNLAYTRVTSQELKNLANARKLQSLNLIQCKMNLGGFNEIANLKDLEYLHLGKTEVDDDCIAELNSLNKLEELNVAGCPITDKCISTLESMPSLKSLTIKQTKISEIGYQKLKKTISNTDYK